MTRSTAARTEEIGQAAPWPEVEIEIDRSEIEKLLVQVSSGREGKVSHFAKVMKARWLLENFKLKGDHHCKTEMTIKVQRAAARQLQANGELDGAADALSMIVDLLKSTPEKDSRAMAEFLASRATIRRLQNRWTEALADLEQSRKWQKVHGES